MREHLRTNKTSARRTMFFCSLGPFFGHFFLSFCVFWILLLKLNCLTGLEFNTPYHLIWHSAGSRVTLGMICSGIPSRAIIYFLRRMMGPSSSGMFVRRCVHHLRISIPVGNHRTAKVVRWKSRRRRFVLFFVNSNLRVSAMLLTGRTAELQVPLHTAEAHTDKVSIITPTESSWCLRKFRSIFFANGSLQGDERKKRKYN